MKKILLLNGPNLDMLGTREPEIYGHDTLDSIEQMAMLYAQSHDAVLTALQSNSEAELINALHASVRLYDGVVYNPGAHTHYSYALRDAIGSVDIPVVEVHISDISKREAFRNVSVIAPACVAQVRGLGVDGYKKAIDILLENDGLTRLGEGYEQQFAADEKVIIGLPAIRNEPADEAADDGEADSGEPLQENADAPSAAEPEPEPEPADAPPADSTGEAEDFAAAYMAEVPAADLGLISYERQQLVRESCTRLGLDALIVRDTSNIRWLAAFDDVFDEESAHALVITDAGSALHTDSRYSNALRNAARSISSDITISDERVGHAAFAKSTLSTGEATFEGRLGIEDSVTYAEFVKMVKTFGAPHLAATTDLVRGLRAVKDDSELSRLMAAQAVTDAAFMHIVDFMKPGMTEREVQLELESFMLRHGGEGLAFSSIVATGANGADPHAIPGKTRLEAGQCVVMDFGARAFGYCSDMTRVVFLGQPDAKMAEAWEVLRQANETVEAMLRPGVTGKEAHETAERVLAEGGFAGAMGHGLGHGVGIDVHELPVLSPRNEAPLVVGNVVTVEPGIYLPGEFGMRLEDCGVITPSGYEVFSNLDHEMVVI